MFEKLNAVEGRFEELTRLMADPEIAQDYERVAEYAKERAALEEIVDVYRAYKDSAVELEETQSLLTDDVDPELRELAKAEVASLQTRLDKLENRLQRLLLPRDPRDDRDVIVEIRAGAGGDEAGLFAADLYRMYTRYAERKGWNTELLSEHPTGVGGFKEVVFGVQGRGVFSRFKFESGVHRVQRVPKTESSGRIHTSTATVAVLPEVDEVEIHVDPKDLEIEAYGASGPGGQHMQKNATAIRITHVPSGIVVACQSERSQVQNRRRALAVLRARLYERELQKQEAELAEKRRSQVGTGERSEKIRTYNFPQNRVTDHRIGLTLYQLSDVLEGDIDPFVDELIVQEQARQLEALGEGEPEGAYERIAQRS
ncbi:MAG: peptide chain release factor 1 [Chloroflexi bacterium]|nr:MAG: peptide chain release factor 1 [Chloroflexota bacterium]